MSIFSNVRNALELGENLQAAPKKQSQTSVFYLMILAAPISVLINIGLAALANWALPGADAEAIKQSITGPISTAGGAGSTVGSVAFAVRSLMLTKVKADNQMAMAAPVAGTPIQSTLTPPAEEEYDWQAIQAETVMQQEREQPADLVVMP